jgi:hypothetical protein
MEAAEDEPVTLALTVGDLRWELECPVRHTGVDERIGERVIRGTETLLLRRPATAPVYYRNQTVGTFGTAEPRVGLRFVSEGAMDSGELAPLVSFIKNVRVYRHYHLDTLRDRGSKHTADLHLSPTGENAFAVLRNWRDRRQLVPKYEFVLRGLRAAFPELFADLEYQSASDTIFASLIEPKANRPIPARVAPHGWFTALLHLCAVAGAEPGSLIAIDEVENSLHPWAIQKLLDAFRDWSDEHDLTICLATHSPVLLRDFREEPEKLFIMELGQETLPVSLPELHSPEWFLQFSLGDLYAYGEIGNQRRQATPAN